MLDCWRAHLLDHGARLLAQEFERALDYITSHDGVWVTTAGEIAEHFITHHLADFEQAIAAQRTAPRRQQGWLRLMPAPERA